MSTSQEALRAARLEALADASETLIDVLKRAMENDIFDAILTPMMVPAKDGFAYILIKDKSLLDEACPLPPIIAVQGGKALSSLTRRGKGELRIAAIMRPCEVRATIELAKLGQVDLEKVTLISMDCPGALKLSDFSKDPKREWAKFNESAGAWADGPMRPICQICDHSSAVTGDAHLGILGCGTEMRLISKSEKGDDLIKGLGLTESLDLASWEEGVKAVTEGRKGKREEWNIKFEEKVGGTENLLSALATCIDCHNCMRVCPVCYCRLCYFDSERLKHPADDYLDQAIKKGSLRFPPDMMLFHIGRMTHMGLMCVSCGACEDACPSSIPIAQIFSHIADRTQKKFDYEPGRDLKEPLPLLVYREDEFKEGDGDG